MWKALVKAVGQRSNLFVDDLIAIQHLLNFSAKANPTPGPAPIMAIVFFICSCIFQY